MIQRYEDVRNNIQPLDALFFHRLDWRHVKSWASFKGWLSNRIISFAQFASGDHHGWHRFIHVELAFKASVFAGDRERLMLAGFTNNGNGGLQMTFASKRITRYPAAILHVPLRAELRDNLNSEAMMQLLEQKINANYSIKDLLYAESRLLTGENDRSGSFCSEFVIDMYQAAGILPPGEHVWDARAGDVKASPLRGTSCSPKDLLTLPIWDFDKANVIH